MEPRPQPLGEARRESFELGEVLLAHQEDDPQRRVAGDRLGDLREERLLLLLPVVAVELVDELRREELLELVEDENAGLRLVAARPAQVLREREAGELGVGRRPARGSGAR